MGSLSTVVTPTPLQWHLLPAAGAVGGTAAAARASVASAASSAFPMFPFSAYSPQQLNSNSTNATNAPPMNSNETLAAAGNGVGNSNAAASTNANGMVGGGSSANNSAFATPFQHHFSGGLGSFDSGGISGVGDGKSSVVSCGGPIGHGMAAALESEMQLFERLADRKSVV